MAQWMASRKAEENMLCAPEGKCPRNLIEKSKKLKNSFKGKEYKPSQDPRKRPKIKSRKRRGEAKKERETNRARRKKVKPQGHSADQDFKYQETKNSSEIEKSLVLGTKRVLLLRAIEASFGPKTGHEPEIGKNTEQVEFENRKKLNSEFGGAGVFCKCYMKNFPKVEESDNGGLKKRKLGNEAEEKQEKGGLVIPSRILGETEEEMPRKLPEVPVGVWTSIEPVFPKQEDSSNPVKPSPKREEIKESGGREGEKTSQMKKNNVPTLKLIISFINQILQPGIFYEPLLDPILNFFEEGRCPSCGFFLPWSPSNHHKPLVGNQVKSLKL